MNHPRETLLQALADLEASAMIDDHEGIALHGKRIATECLNGQVPKVEYTKPQSLRHLMGKKFPPREWVVRNLLPAGKTLLMFGPSHSGKSLLATQLALLCTRPGGSFLSLPVDGKPRTVLYIMGENDEEELFENVAQQRVAIGHDWDRFHYVDALSDDHVARISTEGGMAWLEWIVESIGADVVILDNLMSLAGTDLKASEAAVFVMEGLKRMSKARAKQGHKLSWMVLAHTRKEGSKKDEGSPMDKLYGAHEWGSYADATAYVGFTDNRQSDYRVFKVEKCRGARDDRLQALISYDKETYTASFEKESGDGAPTPGPKPIVSIDEIIDFISIQHGPVTVKAISLNLGISPETVRKRIKKDDGAMLRKVEGGRFAMYELEDGFSDD